MEQDRVPRKVKHIVGRIVRSVLSWASLLAIPLGVALGLMGFMTLGALLVLGGTLAYFLVDPIMLVLDLLPARKGDRSSRR